MPDYQGNSKRAKETENLPPKKVERVVVNEVVVQKKGVGRKLKELFIAADFRTVARDVAMDVLLPAAKNMMLDALNRGGERLFYKDTARRRSMGHGPRITYNSPVNRGGPGYGGSPLNYAPPQRPGAGTSRHIRNDFILSSREEAELVLERMNDIIDTYEIVSVADLNDLVGLPTSHTDNKWGWVQLGSVPIRQLREGYLIDFPAAEPIG